MNSTAIQPKSNIQSRQNRVSGFPHSSVGEQPSMNPTMNKDAAQHRLHSHLVQFLPEELADELIRHHTSVTYAKDSIIFLQGSPADLMFWIMSGLVKLYCPTF